jgi:catechol-2,3-dioxygenase
MYRADLGREVEFCHTFFGLKDGGALAFFQFADDELYALTQAKAPPQVGSFYHIALKVSDATYDELKQRLAAAGENFGERDHGYCSSIYTLSPDGMILEFTRDPADVAKIDELRLADAHSELARWLGGDRHVNNELRHRD